MKYLLLVIFAVVIAVSCQKNIHTDYSKTSYIQNVKNALMDSLSSSDFSDLEYSKAVITNSETTIKLLRIPFRGVKMSEGFVLLKTNNTGIIFHGFIINLKKNTIERDKNYSYNGVIKISSLNRKEKLESRIVNGYISAFHPEGTQLRSMVVPHQSNVLPDVVVTCYINQEGGGVSYNDWMDLLTFYGEGNGGTYSSTDGGGGGGAGGSEGNVSSSGKSLPDRRDNEEMIIGETINIDFEALESRSPIDINKYLKCFSNIPDNGSTCSITIFSDIPVDDHPDIIFDWRTGSPGHSFLEIKKTNGSESVIQNIGFYPANGWKSLTSGAVTGKFVDNSDHEFNASLKMNITSEQLKNTLTYVSKLSNSVKYDIDYYNCTDFALDVFNYSRPSNPIQVTKIALPYGQLPPGLTPFGSRTPQELYKTLDKMQRANIERANINFPGIKAWATNSNGPCN